VQVVTYYELDLGLNHVVRKWSEQVSDKANLVISVPGGADGPGGVLVCAEDSISHVNQNHETVTALIPRRRDTDPSKGVLIVSYATHKQKVAVYMYVCMYSVLNSSCCRMCSSSCCRVSMGISTR
jgi:splicing factor 3B subunit 3